MIFSSVQPKITLNTSMETHLPPHLGQLLPWSLTEEQNLEIANTVMRDGRRVSIWHVGNEGWTSMQIREPVRAEDRKQTYYGRFRPDIEWRWCDTPVVPIVRPIIEDIASKLFERITRAVVLLVNPGVTLKMHYDPVPGHDYGKGPLYMASDVADRTANRYHDHNRYLSIKTFITTKPGDNGMPILRMHDSAQEYRYDAGRRWFSLNEIEMIHGARPVDHARGVLWIDGFINMAAYDALAKDPIPLVPVEGETPVLGVFKEPLIP